MARKRTPVVSPADRLARTLAIEPTRRTVPDRKQNILLAAERLFAERGFHGVSIRDIAEEAGVQFALVGYYYGPKLQLYQEIFRQRSHYAHERLRQLQAVRAAAAPRTLLEGIVEAFVLPALAVARTPGGLNFLRLLKRGMDEQLREDEEMVRELFDPLAHAYIDAIADAMPGGRRETAAWCYQFMLGALLHHLTDRRITALSRGALEPLQADAARLLVRFISGGIRAAFAPVRH